MHRILIADDEPIELTVISRTIEQYLPHQLEIHKAVNGREAVKLFEENKCEIVLLDIEMPGMNGLEAAEKIREMDQKCSIIFLTAFDEFAYAKKAISVRALEYLLKPGEAEELIAVIEEAIRLAEKNEEYAEKAGNMAEKKEQANQERKREVEDISHGEIRLNAVRKTMLTYIQEHYMEDIALQDVAGAMNYSDAYFCKMFKQCFSKSFIVYLSEFRIERAKELLGDVVINIKDISDKVGYRDSGYFTKVFKRMTGVTPSEYRIQILSSMEGTAEYGKNEK